MAQTSFVFPDTSVPGPTLGDGRPYTDAEWRTIWGAAFTRGHASATRGVFLGYLNELEVTVLGANSLQVATGGGVCAGSILINDAAVLLAPVSAPPATTRRDSVIMDMNLAGGSQYTTRLTYKQGAMGVPPAMTQVANQWQIRLYDYTIDDAGNISLLTDQRQYCRFAGDQDHGELEGLLDDDHTQYFDVAGVRHTTAVHDALNIDADTLDGYHAAALISATVFMGMMCMFQGTLGGSDGHRPIVGGAALETWHQANGDLVNGIQTYDMRARLPIGADGATYVINAVGGSATKNIAHTHAVGTLAAANESTHTHGPGTYSTTWSGTHTHAIVQTYDNAATPGVHTFVWFVTSPSDPGGDHQHNVVAGASAAGSAHTHVLAGATASGGSAVQDIMPPWRGVHFLVYVG